MENRSWLIISTIPLYNSRYRDPPYHKWETHSKVEHLLCRAPNVNIHVYSGEAECGMYKSLGGLRNSSGKPALSA